MNQTDLCVTLSEEPSGDYSLRTKARENVAQIRSRQKDSLLAKGRPNFSHHTEQSISDILEKFQTTGGKSGGRRKYANVYLLQQLKEALGRPDSLPELIYRTEGCVYGLVGVAAVTPPGGDANSQLLALQCLINLAAATSNLSTESARKLGLRLLCASGPYLGILLFSGAARIREAAALALGGIAALGGLKIMKILSSQYVVQSLIKMPSSPPVYYALYHVIKSSAATEVQLLKQDDDCLISPLIDDETYHNCVKLCKANFNLQSPIELLWLLYALSCNTVLHDAMASSGNLIDVVLSRIFYEIFQKSDPFPLVRVLTPLVRMLANLCGGPVGEYTCFQILSCVDLLSIFTSLLSTKYVHLQYESVWWLSNIVNNDSFNVRQKISEIDLLDKLEYYVSLVFRRHEPFHCA